MLEHFKVLYVMVYGVFGGLGVLIVDFIVVSYSQFFKQRTRHKYPLLPNSHCLFHVPTLLSDGRR
ncbi:MAG: hypothetical protein ACI80S_001180 [Pseudohongiellaceae bacterium]|jgi:hypothetical protein